VVADAQACQSGDMADPMRFVVHQHDATTLHWDLRLEAEDGTLKSWAVPKGPSLRPAEKRLAMRTEDHALEYIDFEGLIGADSARGRPVIVWDEGTFESLTRDGQAPHAPVSVTDAVDRGHVSFRLAGHKLVGAFALTRTGREPRERWILVKQRDNRADDQSDLVHDRPESVRSGRTIDDLLA
jgi:DNA ligase D-like protein (predicted 3'-phosphoesterase)